MSPSSPPTLGDARALAAEIETYRTARGLTPAEASRQIGCSTSQMSRWRRGGGISIDQLQKVAAWMGRPLNDLMPLAGYPPALGTSHPAEPNDPGFKAVKAAWPNLEPGRQRIIVELATRFVRHKSETQLVSSTALGSRPRAIDLLPCCLDLLPVVSVLMPFMRVLRLPALRPSA